VKTKKEAEKKGMRLRKATGDDEGEELDVGDFSRRPSVLTLGGARIENFATTPLGGGGGGR